MRCSCYFCSDSDKKVHQGWGGDEPSSELKAEAAAETDAQNEAGSPAGDWGITTETPAAAAGGEWGATIEVAADAWAITEPTPAAAGEAAAADGDEASERAVCWGDTSGADTCRTRSSGKWDAK